MNIGNVIRTYRKEKGFTQEELAKRLGVSTPAVNKWEKGHSLPDITLLAPIARLLEIDTDTLLDYKGDISDIEMNDLLHRLEEIMEKEDLETVYEWVKKQFQLYPKSEIFILSVRIMFYSYLLQKEDVVLYETYVLEHLEKLLCSNKQEVMQQAANLLYQHAYQNKNYEEAKRYLSFFETNLLERKRKEAQLYSKMGGSLTAYRMLEELLFQSYQSTNSYVQDLYLLAMDANDYDLAQVYVNKQIELAKVFEMGKYYEASCQLELATVNQDIEKCIQIMKDMLDSVEDMDRFSKQKIYKHMSFKEIDANHLRKVKDMLIENFKDIDVFQFLQEIDDYKKILNSVD
ncbi:hypothetical protein A4S06_00220 [Erysipelotrichaceae bacterium MTC7]|nr:hypothetical protein A4S06_00220 [Erysipelotrichaceae bacterium MTC7]